MATTLWHVTSQEAASEIVARGFQDGGFRELPDLRGVYLSDRPTWDGMVNAIPSGFAVLAVVIELTEQQLSEFEVVEDGDALKDWREWFVPAEVVNASSKVSLCRDHDRLFGQPSLES